MAREHQYGGQAVIEGVMIRGRDHAAVAVRAPNGDICVKTQTIPGWAAGRLRRIPFLRGMVIFVETLVVGMEALATSASLSADEGSDEQTPPMSGGAIVLMMVVAIALAVTLFFLAPFFLSKAFESWGMGPFAANLFEGALRIGAFVGYVWLVSRISDIERVYAYHGAEHMAVAAREAGETLTLEAVKKYPRAHPRCGTAFLLTVMLVALIIFVFVPRNPIGLVVASRVLMVPLIAAVSYEFIRFTGRHPTNVWVRIFSAPNLLLQELTTRPPSDDQVEVAITALSHAVALDDGRIRPDPPGSRGHVVSSETRAG